MIHNGSGGTTSITIIAIIVTIIITTAITSTNKDLFKNIKLC